MNLALLGATARDPLLLSSIISWDYSWTMIGATANVRFVEQVIIFVAHHYMLMTTSAHYRNVANERDDDGVVTTVFGARMRLYYDTLATPNDYVEVREGLASFCI